MTRLVTSAQEKANGGGARSCTDSCSTRHLTDAIVATLRAVFPRKTWAHLINITLISERTAKYRMTGEREFTADELARLIRSEHGLAFLSAIMADAQPSWWVRLRATSRVAAMRKEQLRIKEALHEAEELAATLARAETALAVCDEDFHRDDIAALGTARGDLRRAMAR